MKKSAPFIGALLAFSLEAGAAFSLWARHPFLIALAWHLAAVMAAAGGFRAYQLARRRKSDWEPLLFFSFCLFAFFPVAGPVMSLALLASVRGFGNRFRKGIFEDYEKYISEKSVSEMSGYRFGHLSAQFREEVSFEPLSDIIAGREAEMKIKAIAKIARTLSASHVQLLKFALKDPSPEIRLSAANAFLKMENQINEKIERAARSARLLGTARAWADLGDLYRVYSELGMLNQKLSHYYYRISAEAYKQSLDLDTNQPEIAVHYARCLLKQDQARRAADFLAKAIQLWPERDEIVFLFNEANFQLRRFDMIEKSFSPASGKELSEEEKEVRQFWITPLRG